jgi:hypothetical protein
MRRVRKGISIEPSNRELLYNLGRGFHEWCKRDARRFGKKFNRYYGDVVKRQATVFAVLLPGESPLSIFGGSVRFDENDAEVQIKSSLTITVCAPAPTQISGNGSITVRGPDKSPKRSAGST